MGLWYRRRMMKLQTMLMLVLFSSMAFGEGPLPAEVAELKAKRDAKIREIESAYLGALSKLRDSYLAKGESEKAESVDGLLSGGNQNSAEAQNPSGIVGKWRRDYDKAIFEFYDATSGIYGGDTPFTMTYDEKTKRFTLTSKKWVDTISFTLHKDVLKGGHFNKLPYKLERVR